MPKRRYVKGQVRIDTVLAFVFGVIFLGAILYFTVTVVNPSPYQMQTFKTVLAIAAAGVAAMIPGQFEFRHLPFVRAGGAIAVFAVIFLTPASLVSSVAQYEEPKMSPEPVIRAYLAAVDRKDYDALWQQIDPAAPKWFSLSKEGWREIYSNVRGPLGPVVQRRVISGGSPRDPQGLPPGLYRLVIYETKYGGSENCRAEHILVRATDELTWRVFSHTISLQQMPCLTSLAPNPNQPAGRTR